MDTIIEIVIEVVGGLLEVLFSGGWESRRKKLETDGSMDVEWVTVIKKSPIFRRVTVEFPNGDSRTFQMPRELYQKMVVGEVGRLTYEGRRAFDFQ